MEKLDKKNIEEILALTPMQEGMLFHYLKDPASDHYFEQLNLEITGDIDWELFSTSWNFVVEINEMLRTLFRWRKLENPIQVILREYKIKPGYYDLSGKESSEKKKRLEDLKTRDRNEKFNLREVPFRVTLIRTGEYKYEMIISNHHILYDGWSNGILLKEFFQVYHSLDEFRGKKDQWIKSQAKNSFKEFVQWIRSQDKDKQKQFWEGYLSGFTSRTELPTKIKKRDTETSTRVENHWVILEKTIKDQLEFFARKHRLTLATFFYSAWGLLLQAYCGSEDVIFGTTVSGRSAPIKGIEVMVGLFINTIPLRIKTGTGETIMNLLDHIDDILARREKYESTPLVDIKKYSAVENNQELFDTIVVIENYPLDHQLMQQTGENSGRSLEVDSYSIFEATTYDLTISITMGNEIGINFLYNLLLFEESSILRLACHFTNILNGILENPGQTPDHLELLSEGEKHRLLYDFNDTSVPYPADKAVYQLVEEQVCKTPGHIAVIGKRAGAGGTTGQFRRVTYRQLNEEANQLARILRNQGIKTAKTVGIMMERSVDMVVALLAVLKAGGTYLPIDPEYPENRISRILAHANASILLTHSRIVEKKSFSSFLQRPGIFVVEMDRQEASLRNQPVEDLKPISTPGDLIYIIFTSGSTGTPKGAGVYHRGFTNLIHWFVTEFGLHAHDRSLLLTSLSFDLTQKNFYAPLIIGGTLCIPAFNYFEPRSLIRQIYEWQVTWINCTPGMFHKIVEYEAASEEKRLSSLRYVFLGGEPIFMSGFIRWLESQACRAEIVNTYGPTECTDICNYYRIKDPSRFLKEAVPIGKPVYNVKLYIVDRNLHLLPVGVPGELLIGGAGVGIGYIDDKNLSAQKFIKYSFAPGEPEQLLYHSGDLAKWLPDGNIEFLGRIDHQVKVRGFRIELVEIESRLLTHPAVKEAVVTARQKEGTEKYLCAYIVPYSGQSIEKEELRDHLSLELPAYMVPPYLIMLEEMPLTANGKVDRKALPEPDLISGSDFIPPRDDTENMLAEIWAEVLEIDKKKIGIHDDFFRLGGHSLKATALTGRIYKTFSVEIPINKIFEKPTLEDISRFIARAKETLYLAIKPIEKKEYYPLSSPQERLFLIQQMDPSGITYNLAGIKELHGKPDKKRLEKCFRKLIQRHESLRTSFELIGEEPVQKIHREVAFQIESYLATGDTEEEKRIIDFVRPFDLAKVPLLRIGLVHLHTPGPVQEGNIEGKHLLMFDMHHIISDGVSMEIFIKEFTALYAGDESLPELRLHYKDFSHWQNNLLISPGIKKQETYWLHQFEGEIPVLELPLDYPRPPVQQFAGKQVSFAVGEEKTGELNRFVRDKGGTRFTVLLAVFSLLLSRLSNREDIVVGTPAAGRSHHDLENIIGMFVNTLALRIDASGRMTFTEFTRNVKKNFLAAFENQDYPYEYLVDRVVVNRDLSRNPLFDAGFLLQGIEMGQVELPTLELTPYEYEVSTSKFDLSLLGSEIPGNISFTFEYSTNLFKESTIRRYISYFKELLSNILTEKGRYLWEIEIIPQEEKQQVLFDFNDTAAEFPGEKTIYELFDQQVERTPDNVAVMGANQLYQKEKLQIPNYPLTRQRDKPGTDTAAITYRELNRQANQLAHLLLDKGVEPDSIVAIMVERSVQMIIGMLGILKAGGAYLPIDPEYPRERIDFMLKDSKSKIVLTSPAARGKVEVKDKEKEDLIDITDISTGFSSSTLNLISSKVSPANLAYIIYTSGSTGQPKGVLIQHQGVLNMVWFHREVFKENTGSRISQVASPAFDAMAFEVWPCLLGGAALYIIENEMRMDPDRLKDWLIRHQITISFQPTLMAQELLEVQWPGSGTALKILRTAGERLYRYPTRSYPFRLYNLYGPTEDTVWTTWAEIPAADSAKNLKPPPIGKPVANKQVYILSSKLKPQPLGVAGELCISGNGLARGYLNRPGLTAEKFKRVVNDQCPLINDRLYRTGDLARWLEDGNIEFIGRQDLQVKIRGFRIEPGEIENYLLGHGSIKETLVLARENGKKEKYLCAYMVSDAGISIPGLRNYLARNLPPYMVPSYFVVLDKMPLTPNGKIDRRALPEPEIALTKKYIAPGNKTEERLVETWSDVLGIEKEKIGIHDNFFELGGHSLKAAALVSRIHKELNVKVPMVQIFENPTVEGLSRYIQAAAGDKYTSIAPVEEKEYYELSSAQKRLYILYQLDKSSKVYNIPYAVKLGGELDRHRWEAASGKLIDRHESLRTSFKIIDEEPVQRIHEEVKFEIRYHDASHGEKEEKNHHSALMIHDFIRAFDLSKPPLIRMGLIKESHQHYILVVDMHHIISDGMSASVLLNDFTAYYRGNELPAMKLQYKDYAGWQIREKESENHGEKEKYWRKEFERESPVLDLPADYPRPALQSFEGSTINFEITRETLDALKAITLETGTTLYMALLALYTILLSRLGSQEDIVIGTPTAGRRHADLEKIIGMFVNTLGIRNYPEGEKNFAGFLQELKERTLAAFENQEYPFEDLVEKVKVNRDPGRNPLFDVMFSIQDINRTGIEIPGLKSIPYNYENKISKFDLSLNVVEIENRLQFTFEYCTRLFKAETIERFTHYFKKIVASVLKDTGQKICEIDIMPDSDKTLLLYEFNDTSAQYPGDKTLHELFAEQVERRPDNIAIVYRHSHLNYNELNKQANQLAWILKDKCIKPEAVVGIMLTRSLEMITAILAVLKAGGTYMPIDIEYPGERIQYMLEDSNARIFFTQAHLANKNLLKGEVIEIDGEVMYSDSPNPGAGRYPGDPAYIIYTSGSTGNPKGILVEHYSVVNLAFTQKRYFNINQDDRVLQFSSICFDASVEQIFIALFSGAVLVLIDKEVLLDHKRFETFIADQGVTHLHAVPSFLNNIHLQDKYNLKRVISGGDVCPLPLAQKWSKYCDFYNEYGPTETTITSIRKRYVKVEENLTHLPIGNPISNTTVYLLDKWLKLVPPGTTGELYIGGKGVARGYLNRPALTLERFILNPFKKGERLFRTGDHAKWMPDGNLEFLGRADHQVKIRGFRIELGEIESRLNAHGEIKEAVVVARESKNGEKYLCAYIVANNDPNKCPVSQLREYLSQKLPDYMIPSYFVILEKIPLTASGKTDRKALPEPGLAEGLEAYTAPRDEIEEKLVDIWSEVLTGEVSHDQSPIGIDANFFQWGGHSLKAVGLAAKVHKVFNVRLPLEHIFKSPTIRGISQYIKRALQEHYQSIVSAEEKEYYILSSAQQRLYFLQQLDKSATAYNMPSVWLLRGNMDRDRLHQACKELIQRHESLRTWFEMVGEAPVQRIHDQVEFEIEYNELKEVKVEVEDKHLEGTRGLAPLLRNLIRPFDLSHAPLLRVGLLNLGKQEHLLMVDLHHIISDGISSLVLVEEFMRLYPGERLCETRLQYRDYAEWQKSGKRSSIFIKQEEYWKKELAGEVPVLDLPTDIVRPALQDFDGSKVSFEMGRTGTNALKSLALEEGATLYMVLLALYTILLSKLTTQGDILVGAPVAGRRHGDLKKVIGMFVNTLVLRNQPGGEKTFLEFLAEVKESTLQAFENQEYQYEDLVEQVAIRRDLGRNPLFDVSFLLQNMEGWELEIPGLQVTPYEYDTHTAKFDLMLEGTETRGTLLFQLQYRTALFKQETIKRFIEYYKNIVSGVLKNKAGKISGFEIISETEKKQVLYDFNETTADYPKEKTIQELFEECTGKSAHHIAIVGPPGPGHIQLTYEEFNAKTNQLGGRLRERGIKANVIVGILVEPSIEMIIGIFAILKAGGGYLPLDPGYPGERIKYILEDSETQLLLAQKSAAKTIETGCEVIDLEDGHFYRGARGNHVKINRPADLAYVIYTSGSTGRPKGVLIEHGSVVNILAALFKKYPFTKGDSYLLKTSYVFDVSVTDLFGWFWGGGRLALLGRRGEKDPQQILATIERAQITHINFVPSMFNIFLEILNTKKIDKLTCLKYIFLAGEVLLPDAVKKFIRFNLNAELENIYGPTEGTIYASKYSLSQWEGSSSNHIPIGKPLANMMLYILDKYDHLQPLGAAGELCISGTGLARGYLNRPELTNEKFDHDLWYYQDYQLIKNYKLQIANTKEATSPQYPFTPIPHSPIYRTGDLARWLADGNIEFLGRIDHQIKIRGFRIEPGEIENHLLKHERIKEAVVVTGEDEQGDRYLCAYIVPALSPSSKAFDVTGLRNDLLKFLPDYMIPSYFVQVDDIPLTPAQKAHPKGTSSKNIPNGYMPFATKWVL